LVNNCTGNFAITCRTASGSGVSVPTGLTAYLYCDGTNISQDSNILGIPGRLINVQVFSSSGTYTPTRAPKPLSPRFRVAVVVVVVLAQGLHQEL
jgi:hypothetical protein